MNAAKEVISMGCGRSQQPGDCELRDIIVHDDANKCSEDEKLWLKSIINGQSKHGDNQTTGLSKIQKVPRILGEVEANKSCYVPLMVSIGPFHHGKPELKLMEKHKSIMVRQYANDNLEKLEQLYTKVKDVAKAARECYSDEDGTVGGFDDLSFARMMFIDGCFLLQFIYCCTQDKPEYRLKIKSNVAACVQRDLLLLENQLPFQVLKELLISRFKENEWKSMLSAFIWQICGPTHKDSSPEVLRYLGNEHAHLLEVVRAQLIDKYAFTEPRNFSDWSSYRSAKELKAVGIHFRPSGNRQFTDIDFKSMFFAAFLKLPQIKIDDSTKSMLLNMVAYEACLDGPDDFGVSSYICFMDSLIDHAEDVKELRSKGILLNFLGSDQQVADLFNQISDNLVSNRYAYAVVKDRIEKHYKNKIKIWMAEWLHTHFTSPWTLLAFLGAIFALVLSVIQTYETVYSSNDSQSKQQ